MLAHPKFPPRWTRVLGPFALTTAVVMGAACGPKDAPLVRIEIAGVAVNEANTPLPNVRVRPNPQQGAVRSGGDVFTNARGQYTLSITVPQDADHATFRATLAGRAPQTVWLPLHAGVEKYGMRFSLMPLSSAPLTPGSATTLNTMVNGRPATIRVGAVPPGATLRYALLPVPTLLPASGEAGTALQAVTPSVFLDVTDAAGVQVANPPEMTVTLDPTGAPPIADASALEALTLTEEGLWDQTRPLGGTGASQTFTAQAGSVTLVGRRFRTACAVGRVEAISGPCPGGYVAAQGTEGVFSLDTANANGDFCVTGVAGSSVNVFSAATTRQVSLRSTIGTCAIPADCQNVATFQITPQQCSDSAGTGP